MDDQNEDDFNDIMFGLNEPLQRQEIASVSNDSNLGLSVSDFGIDRDNPQENHVYIQENQDLRVIIQGIGVALSDATPEDKDSGLATSISKSRNSEFIPEIIEYQRQEDFSITNSELNEIIDLQPGPSGDENDYESDMAESLQEIAVSTFDLALEKGYLDQAKIAYDAATSKGSHVKSKFSKKLKNVELKDDDLEKIELEESLDLEDVFWSKELLLQKIYMLQKDFKGYLENLERNEWKKVLNQLEYKKLLNTIEIQIKKNIKTKRNRNDLKLKKETITIINKYIEKLEHIEIAVKEMNQKQQSEKEQNESDSILTNEMINDQDFDEDGATGFTHSSSSAMNASP